MELTTGVLQEVQDILKRFFKDLRVRVKKEKGEKRPQRRVESARAAEIRSRRKTESWKRKESRRTKIWESIVTICWN